MVELGKTVVIFWYYRRLTNGEPDPYSIDAQTGAYRGKNANGDDMIIAADGRTYTGTLCPEYTQEPANVPQS